ncbi:MAG TPA: hypothetical protein VD969_29670 [Symbiobacteriaceae bacterium]|nr:hypothetical protein [Symbiobacteriaceae bacterium]
MKVLMKIGIILSLTLLASQTICGLWIGSKGAEASSIKFHVVQGLIAVSVTAITLIVAAVSLRATAR